jgi:hypothetical protein
MAVCGPDHLGETPPYITPSRRKNSRRPIGTGGALENSNSAHQRQNDLSATETTLICRRGCLYPAALHIRNNSELLARGLEQVRL